MNKKGILNEVWIVIIIFIAFMTIILGIWFVGTVAPLIIGEGQMITSTLSTSIAQNSPNSSLQNASVVPIQTANSLMGLAEGIIYLAMIGAFLGFLVVCYYVRTYKWLSMVWIVFVIGAVIISMVVSNAYQDAYNSSDHLASLYSQWGTNDFLLNYLPVITGGLGVMGGIILFALAAVGTDEETEAIR